MEKINENHKHLGFLMRVARKERKMTQVQLAKLVRTKQSSIARAEKGHTTLAFTEKAVGALGFEISNIALRAKDPFAKGLKFYG